MELIEKIEPIDIPFSPNKPGSDIERLKLDSVFCINAAIHKINDFIEKQNKIRSSSWSTKFDTWNKDVWIKTTKSLRKSLGLSKKEFNELTLSELSEYIKAAK